MWIQGDVSFLGRIPVSTLRRDVKPSNILLTKHGVAKVADVGIASMVDHFSSAGAPYGTFAFAAPEVLMGEKCSEKVRILVYRVSSMVHAGPNNSNLQLKKLCRHGRRI